MVINVILKRRKYSYSIDKMIGILFHRGVLYEDLFLIRKERIKLGYMHGSKAAEKETYIDRMVA